MSAPGLSYEQKRLAQDQKAPAPPRAAPTVIPGFDKMSFEQQRHAQDQLAAARRR